jgi:hypothetical protein
VRPVIAYLLVTAAAFIAVVVYSRDYANTKANAVRASLVDRCKKGIEIRKLDNIRTEVLQDFLKQASKTRRASAANAANAKDRSNDYKAAAFYDKDRKRLHREPIPVCEKEIPKP